MRKIILLLLTIFTLYSTGFSQAYEGKTDYDKKKQDAFMIDYPYPQEAVENALVKKMEQLGYKGKEEKGLFNKDKGFRVYRDAYVTDISSGSMDYVFKVESKGKKDKALSVVYMVILGKDGANAKSIFESRDVEKAKSFLNNLQPMMEAANLELQIKNQEEQVVKAEKKLKDLRDDQDNIEKKIRKLQEDLKDNSKDQDKQQKEIDNQRQILETMKGKRKSE
jgi:hypothetical protein